MWLDRTGKGPITCQYRHYWRTERNINVYDPMRAHPNPCPFLYTPRVRSTVFPTVALKFSSPTNLHFSDSSTPPPPSPKYTPLGSRYPSRRFHRSSLQSRSKFATLSSSFPANKRGMRAAGREERASVANVAAIRIPSLTRSSKSPSPSVVVDHDALLYPLPFRGGCV